MIQRDKTIKKYSFDPFIKKGNSLKLCVMTCDVCAREYEKQLCLVCRGRKKIKLDTCGSIKCAQEKTKRSNMLIHGVESTNQLKRVKEKKHNGCVEGYKKMKEAVKIKYGVSHPHKNKDIRHKYHNTMKKRHGVLTGVETQKARENLKLAFKNNQTCIVDKRKQTCINKYGVDNPGKVDEFVLKRKKTNLDKYGTEDVLNRTRKITNRLSLDEILQGCQQKGYEFLSSYDDYTNNRNPLRFNCIIHNEVFVSKVFYVKDSKFHQCPKCRNIISSQQEKEVGKFLEEHVSDIVRNDRTLISPFELDMVVKEFNFAVEFHGLYWHSELYKNKRYHLNKFIKSQNNDIHLLQIYEDEWRDKKEIWKSILLNKVGKSIKFDARKLQLNVSPSFQDVKVFLNKTHLQGHCNYKKAFTLENQNKEIVYCITFRKPFTKKQNVIEIARVSSALNSSVRGGFSRIMKYAHQWALSEGFSGIITYSDCRYSWGDVYKKYGFSLVRHTNAGYDYTDFINRFNRFKYRAKEGKPETQVALENNMYRIYNSGNYLWGMSLVP